MEAVTPISLPRQLRRPASLISSRSLVRAGHSRHTSLDYVSALGTSPSGSFLSSQLASPIAENPSEGGVAPQLAAAFMPTPTSVPASPNMTAYSRSRGIGQFSLRGPQPNPQTSPAGQLLPPAGADRPLPRRVVSGSAGAPSQILAPHRPSRHQRRSSRDLFEFIERNPRLPEPTLRLLFRQVAEAVQHVHARGFCHRDLKDENVVVDQSLRVRLIDFGAARPVASSLAAGVPGAAASAAASLAARQFADFAGSRPYMSPEAARGEPHGGRELDAWGLGVLLFVLAEARYPFPDDPSHPRAPRPPLRAAARSAELEDLLDRLLCPDPAARATVADVLMHPWLAGAEQ
ncbi:hypothetical protein HK405_012774 [Cladochytrium tenue]|nr:hypothetical protein HK405_012774 [Cladochytrium tenue]